MSLAEARDAPLPLTLRMRHPSLGQGTSAPLRAAQVLAPPPHPPPLSYDLTEYDDINLPPHPPPLSYDLAEFDDLESPPDPPPLPAVSTNRAVSPNPPPLPVVCLGCGESHPAPTPLLVGLATAGVALFALLATGALILCCRRRRAILARPGIRKVAPAEAKCFTPVAPASPPPTDPPSSTVVA